jgi:histone H3/H4
VFCSLQCFDAHVPVLNHRDAGAFEKKAPSQKDFEVEKDPTRKDSKSSSIESTSQQTLVVVSKVKDYIRSQSGLNTSDSVMRILTEYLERKTDQAIENAKKSGRKTVLDRDIT